MGVHCQLSEKELPLFNTASLMLFGGYLGPIREGISLKILVVHIIFCLFFIHPHFQFYPQDHVYELLNTIDACQCHFDIVRFFVILFYLQSHRKGLGWDSVGWEGTGGMAIPSGL